jgi:hypothetical protein
LFVWANANAGDAFYRERFATGGDNPEDPYAEVADVARDSPFRAGVGQLPSPLPPARFGTISVPGMIADTEKAAEQFLEYSAGSIRSPNTRAAYVQAAGAACPSSTKDAVSPRDKNASIF